MVTDEQLLLHGVVEGMLGAHVCSFTHRYVSTCMYLPGLTARMTVLLFPVTEHVYSPASFAVTFTIDSTDTTLSSLDILLPLRRVALDTVMVCLHSFCIASLP